MKLNKALIFVLTAIVFAHDVSGKCGGLQMSDPRNYGQYIYQPYVGDTDWAACFVAPNQNAAESDLQCPHSFLKIEDHNRDCKDLFDNSPQRRTLKRVCCLIQPHATTEVINAPCLQGMASQSTG